ncbi:MAG: broad specificity phosphatase PhoE [bacterium]|jgi:broad specificity phosphatase PhoE
MKNIFLVRHGHTIWSQTGGVAGRSDIPLSDTGEAAVTTLGQTYNTETSFSHWYCSPLQRTRQTSSILRAGLSAVSNHRLPEVCIDSRLVELDFGDWEGMTWDEVHQDYEQTMRHWGEDWVNRSPPNGESFDEQVQRCSQWLKDWEQGLDSQIDSATMVVAHGGTIRAILCLCLNWSLSDAMSFNIDPASICWLQQVKADAPWLARMINSRRA